MYLNILKSYTLLIIFTLHSALCTLHCFAQDKTKKYTLNEVIDLA